MQAEFREEKHGGEAPLLPRSEEPKNLMVKTDRNIEKSQALDHPISLKNEQYGTKMRIMRVWDYFLALVHTSDTPTETHVSIS